MDFDTYYQSVAFAIEIKESKLFKLWYKNKPVVIVRINKIVYAYRDFCPHRGAPLSLGVVRQQEIHCLYHGWSFNCENGENTFLPVKNKAISCKLSAINVLEKYGLIWLSDQKNAAVPNLLDSKPSITKSGFINAKSIHVVENFLEGSHTHFIHDGLIRSQKKARQKINALLVPDNTGFKVFYDAESAKGLVTKIIPKKFQRLKPVATYIFPYTAILDYFNQNDMLIARFEGIISSKENRTQYFARIFLNFGIASPILAFFAKYIFGKIIGQDKKILEIQEENLVLFPENGFVSDETDIVGQQIFAWMHDKSKILTESLEFKVFW